jgi:hypothetical protein
MKFDIAIQSNETKRFHAPLETKASKVKTNMDGRNLFSSFSSRRHFKEKDLFE